MDPQESGSSDAPKAQDDVHATGRHPDFPYDDIIDPKLLPFTLEEQDTFLKVCSSILLELCF